MRKTLRCTGLILLNIFSLSLAVTAQTPIGSSGAATQTFDGMLSGNVLPANWKMSAAGTGTSSLGWNDVSNVSTTSVAANAGSPSTGGRYNWGTTAGTDRAIGFMTDALYNSPNAIMAFYRNNSGSTIQSFTVGFNIERYKTDAAACSISFYTSADGINWTLQAGATVDNSAFPPGALSYSFASPASVARSITFNNAGLPNNGSLYFKWVFVNTGSTNSQGLGLDDVTLTVNTAIITANLGDVLTDTNSDGFANPGETITYKDTIKNTGVADALSLIIADTLAPAGTTKIPGTVKTSAVAADDNFATPFNSQLTGQNVLLNDFGIPAPMVITYGTTASGGGTTTAGTNGVTDNGGTVNITAGGALTYSPPNNFTGIDKFKYIAGTGVGLPNNDAIVNITVGAAPVSFTSSHTDPLCNNNTNGSITVIGAGGSGTYLYSKDNGVNFQASNVFTNLASGTYQLVIKDAITGSTQSGTETLLNPTAVSFTFARTDITCNNLNNGSIIFNPASGGSGPYSYSITGAAPFSGSTSFTGLAAGAYTLVVKDNNGCLSATSSSTVVNPTVVTVSGSASHTLTYTVAMSSATYTKTGGTGALVFSMTGTLPGGISFNTGTGVLAGTATQTGAFPVTIIATDVNGCTGSLTVTINVAPKITGETFTGVGNTQLAGGVAAPVTPAINVSSLAANDASDATITYSIATAPTQGVMTLNADGSFLYTPAAGNITAATFTYTGTSNTVTSAAVTATINFSGKVWYVKAGGAAGDGRSNTPLNALPSGNLGVTGDFIYVQKEVSGTTPGGITLQASQQLIGAGATLSVPTITPILNIAGNAINIPTLTGTVTLANTVTVNGIDMSTGASTAITNSGATVTGVNVTARNVTTTTGTGLSITGTGNNVTMTLTSLTTNGAVNGVNLAGTGGTITITGGSLTGGGGGAVFNISGGTANITYGGTISQASAQRVINIANVTGGTILFSGAITGTGTNTGIGLTTNGGATINFTGVISLDGTACGFSASGGGTLSITNAGCVIGNTTAPTSTALTILNTTIGSGGILFKKISCSGGTKGISLNNTGNGPFTISGTDGPDAGTLADAGTGGTIQNTNVRGVEFITVGGAIALNGMNFINAVNSQTATGTVCTTSLEITESNVSCNAVVHLQSTTGGVTLNSLIIDGGSQMGINGNNVINLVLNTIEIKNVGDESAEHGILLKNTLGTGSMTNINLHDNEGAQLYMVNAIGTLSSMNISSSNFANSFAPNGAQGIVLSSYGSGVIMNVDVSNSTFTNLFSNGHQAAANTGSTQNINLTGCTFNNTGAWTAIQSSNGATVNFTVNDNSGVTGVNSAGAIYIKTDNGLATPSGSFATGTISGNTIGNNNTGSGAVCGGGCSGISVNQRQGGTLIINITGNTIRHVDATGISVTGGQSQAGNPGKLIATITGNLIKDPDGGALSFAGIYVTSGVVSADNNCLTGIIGGTFNPGTWPSTAANAMNRIEGDWGTNEIRIRRLFVNPIFHLPGFSGAPDAWVAGRNSIPSVVGTSVSAANGSGGNYTNGTSCN